MKYTYHFVFIIPLMILSSCGGSSLEQKRLLLTEKKWITHGKMEFRGSNGEWQMHDWEDRQLPSCERDDYWVFRAGGTIDVFSGIIRCGSERISKQMTWSFVDDGKKMVIDGDTVEVTKLSSDQLQITPKDIPYVGRQTFEILQE